MPERPDAHSLARTSRHGTAPGRARWAAAAVALAALLATGPALTGSFVYDDAYYVVENPAVSGSASPWTSPLGPAEQALWRPITVATWRAQWPAGAAAGDVSAGPFRAVNVALHVLVSLLVVAVGRRLGLGAGASFVAGLLFAVHPVHAEAVAWVSGRAELLAAALVLGAWWAYAASRPAGAWLAALLFALAALSKENALAAPLLFALGDVLLPAAGAEGRRLLARVQWGRLAMLAAIALGIWLVRGAVLGRYVPDAAPFGALAPAERALVAVNILGRALQLIAWPADLRVHYHRDEFVLWQPAALAAIALVAAAALLLLRRRAPCVGAALLLVPAALLPVLNLVPIGETFAERFLYLPSAFACLAAGALVASLARAELRRGAGLGASAATTLLAVAIALPACRAAVAVFRDDLSLWAHAARVAPHDAHARYNHGYFLDAAGREIDVDRGLPGSGTELAVSLRLEPHHPDAAHAHHMLGIDALGANPAQAAYHFRAAVGARPDLLDSRLNLATVALSHPSVVPPSEALAHLEAVLAAPGLDDERRLLAAELMDQLEDVAAASEGATGTSSPEGS